ncbi:MAG: molybdopterin-dependent oxidoreductase, partial [Anaerolineae bacterium]
QRRASLCLTVPECNSLGLALLGHRSLEEASDALHGGTVDTVIVLENDLYRREEVAAVDDLLTSARHVIALDHLENQTNVQAHIALPAATFAETSGTLVNNEGRAQRFYQVFVPEGEVQASWRWVRDLMIAAGRLEADAWQTLDDLVAAMIEALPVLKQVEDAAPPAALRLVGRKVPREPQRYTARTAMHAQIDINEPKPPEDPDTPLAFSMEGYEGQPPPALIPRYWAPHWNSVQSLNKFQEEIAGPLRGGEPGARLVEPGSESATGILAQAPAAYRPRDGLWLVVPIYHIFGSEELSVLAPGIAELAPAPYLALHPEDAAGLAACAGDELEFRLQDRLYRLPLRLLPTLPKGVAGLPSGLPEGPETIYPRQWLAISRGVET